MKPKKKDLTLEYLNKRIDRLNKKFKQFEDLVYSWKRKDDEDIDKIKEQLSKVV